MGLIGWDPLREMVGLICGLPILCIQVPRTVGTYLLYCTTVGTNTGLHGLTTFVQYLDTEVPRLTSCRKDVSMVRKATNFRDPDSGN